MGEDKSYTTLERIKNGSILPYLIDCSDLEGYLSKGTKSRQELAHIVGKFNKKGIMPKLEDLESLPHLNNHYKRRILNQLVEENVVCKLTIPQLFNKFGYRAGRHPKLPESLNNAVKGEFENMEVRRGQNFSKKMNVNPLASYWKRFYLALLTESSVGGKKVPVFQSIFDFLPYYKT